MRLTRRGLLVAAAVSGLGPGLLSACGEETASEAPAPLPAPEGSRRISYGTDPSQFAELRMPIGEPRATVVLLHGGYWYPQYGLEQLHPMAAELSSRGFATWNVEYRRTGARGGFPDTLDDVARAIDRLGSDDLPKGLSDDVVLVGHSAGGHLAVWAASRTDATPGGRAAFPLRGVVSLAGVLDLTRAAGAPGSSTPVTDFMGGSPQQLPDRYDDADPARLVPATCPVRVLRAANDTTVPAEQGARYAAASRAAGGDVSQVVVPGDHMTIIDPTAESFDTVARQVQELSTRPR